jgi:hypothetical protein
MSPRVPTRRFCVWVLGFLFFPLRSSLRDLCVTVPVRSPEPFVPSADLTGLDVNLLLCFTSKTNE